MSDQFLDEYIEKIKCNAEDLAEELLRIAKKISKKAEIIYRIKDPQKIRRKLKLKKASSVFKLDDVFGFRILVPTIEEIRLVKIMIVSKYKSKLDHDYISEPKVRPEKTQLAGKKLRLMQIISYKNSVPFEIQITTPEFDIENESVHEQYSREKYPQ